MGSFIWLERGSVRERGRCPLSNALPLSNKKCLEYE